MHLAVRGTIRLKRPGLVLDGEPAREGTAVAADVRGSHDEVVSAVAKRPGVEVSEPEEVRARLRPRVMVSQHGHVLVRPSRIDLPERAMRQPAPEIRGDLSLAHDLSS